MPDTPSRDEDILAELTELSLAAVRKAAARLEAAEDDDAVDRATRNFERLSRGLRHTLALKTRFLREERRVSREDRAEAVKERLGDMKLRRQRLHVAVGYEIEREHEGDEATALHWDLGELLDTEELSEAFTREDFPAQVARLKAALGLGGASTAPVPPPLGEVSAQPTEGVRSEISAPTLPPAAQPTHPGGPPQSAFADSLTNGAATGWLSG